jgi:hypothetical protein
MVDWSELREFSGVDLASSFVLSWHAKGDALVIDLDLCLEPAHPFYEKPRPAEKACIRPAFLEFPSCHEVATPAGESGAPREIIGRLGIGVIAGLRLPDEGCYEIAGEFGTVSIIAERPILRLKGGWP